MNTKARNDKKRHEMTDKDLESSRKAVKGLSATEVLKSNIKEEPLY